jgi:hypothetical protein
MGAKRNACGILVAKPETKKPVERPRRRCVDNIEMGVREMGWCGMDWIDLAGDREQLTAFVITVMDHRIP